ncbi:two-component system response regulator HsbR [Endothiovibrio diazotrophicus]
MRVLIVDDDYTNRLILRAMLVKESYSVAMAEDGREAVELFDRDRHDMVLMDVMMPVMDGYEATRRIKELSGDRFVPVIFLTAVNDDQALARCVEYGGDDFLAKPYNRVILKAKIDAMRRVRNLYATLQSQHDELRLHNQRLKREQEIAEKVFANIVQPGCLEAANLKYLLSSMAVANGDLLLAAGKPSGGQHVMLGDLTGHGLSAAIGAMPVSDLFYRMTEKGYSILDLVVELNQRMKDRLPTGLFLAATLIELDASHSTLTVWNGGLPDVLLCRGGRIVERVASNHLPLGVVDSNHLDNRLEIFEVMEGDRIYIYSDGVIEAVNPAGEMFGQERLEGVLDAGHAPEALFGEVQESLNRFRDGAAQSDDITLIEVTCDADLLASGYDRQSVHLPGRPPMNWGVEVRMEADTLRNVDPLPQLVQVLTELQGLEEHRARIYTVLAELYSNALEHGVLRLDSGLKENPHGFAEYYTRRQTALEGLEEGWIRLTFEHHPLAEGGGRLRIAIADSGGGFDHQEAGKGLSGNVERQGRGIALVRTLCSEVRFLGDGNEVEALYTW